MMVSIIKKNLVKDDFGARSGFVSCGSAVLCSTLGPMILTAIVLKWSWRGAFCFTGLMLLLLGLLMQFTVREVEYPVVRKTGSQSGGNVLKALFTNRVFVLCLVIGIFETAGKMSLTIFGPVYLTEICGLDTKMKGAVLSAMGLVYIPATLIIPALADRFRATKVMAVTFFLCVITPAAMLFLQGSRTSVISYVVFGNLAAATVSIFIYLLPARALPPELTGTANGIIMGASVFFGGFVCPVLLGRIAGTDSGLMVMAGICIAMFMVCGILSLVIDGKNKRRVMNE